MPVRALAARQQEIDRRRARTPVGVDAGIAKRLAIMPAFRMRLQFKPRDDLGGGMQTAVWRPSGLVLALAQLAEHVGGTRRLSCRRCAATDGSSARRNTFAFFSSPSRVGIVGLFVGAQPRHLLGARFQRGIVRLDRQRELDVGSGIFMAAIEFEIVGQRAQLEQRIPHHRIVAFEHPPAADREQRVGGEQRLLGCRTRRRCGRAYGRAFPAPAPAGLPTFTMSPLPTRRSTLAIGWPCRAARPRGICISASVRRRRRHGRRDGG